MPRLADAISVHWYRATDNSSLDRLVGEPAALVEFGYRLGFANALQMVTSMEAAGKTEELRALLGEARAIADLEAAEREAHDGS